MCSPQDMKIPVLSLDEIEVGHAWHRHVWWIQSVPLQADRRVVELYVVYLFTRKLRHQTKIYSVYVSWDFQGGKNSACCLLCYDALHSCKVLCRQYWLLVTVYGVLWYKVSHALRPFSDLLWPHLIYNHSWFIHHNSVRSGCSRDT
jgi:hypothetical protein